MKIKLITINILLFSAVTSFAQDVNLNGDSLSLSAVIEQVINNYPAIIIAQKNINIADAGVNLAKTAYYPNIGVSGSYSHIGPVSSINLSALGMGIMQMFPTDNVSVALNLNQLIYDFGRTAKNIEVQQGSKTINELALENIKQQISLAVAGNFYSIAFLQQAIKIKDEEIAALDEHLKFVNKKAETGSATQFEVLSTKVRISAIENQRTDLESALAIQVSQLNSFLGNSPNQNLLLKHNLLEPRQIEPFESLNSIAFANRVDLKMAEEKRKTSESKLALVKSQIYPTLDFFATGGWKNGYIPELNTPKANYVVGASLKAPIFDSGRTKYNKVAANNEIEVNNQDIELTRRNITNEIVENKSNIDAALKKLQQSEMQLKQAEQAYQLAETSYQAGTITNLDLLDSYTALSDTKLTLFKAKIDYTVNYLKLRVGLGEKIY